MGPLQQRHLTSWCARREYNRFTSMTCQTNLMRSGRKLNLILLLMFCFLPGLHSPAQPQSGRDQRSPAEIEWDTQQKLNAQKKLNEQRQLDIQKDTEKLLQLATELKQYVDKTNEQTLSVSVIKKAEEIEKLAHAVKEKMKGQ